MHQTTFPHFLAVFSFSSLFFRICFLFINFKTQPPIVKTQLERYLNPSVCWFYWNFLHFTHACKCYIRYGVSDNNIFHFYRIYPLQKRHFQESNGAHHPLCCASFCVNKCIIVQVGLTSQIYFVVDILSTTFSYLPLLLNRRTLQ